MPRRAKISKDQAELYDVQSRLLTAPCVPALREAVKHWRAGRYDDITDTTRLLFNHWFYSDHRLLDGTPFKYHPFQQDAMETLVFVYECEKVRSRLDLLRRYAQPEAGLRLPPFDDFARYCVKMATGTGKTKVMSLAIVWQYMNAVREAPEISRDYAKTFLILAPNVIVFERLKVDFSNGRIFRADPLIPKALEVFWDFDCVLRGEGERAHSQGMLFLTNIQQFYERPAASTAQEPEPMSGVMGPKPPTEKLEITDFGGRIAKRGGPLVVVNDEAHHTHDEDNEWNKVIRGLHAATPVAAQFDFSATPRYQKGALFPWTVFDYPLKQAIVDNVVKRPVKGIAHVEEAKSEVASIRYQAYLVAGVERWKEYAEQLKPLKKKPVLFMMLNSTRDADEVAEWLRKKYPGEFGADKTLVIHTDNTGEVSKKDIEKARALARDVDLGESPVNGIVSVLMLREGWDVQGVTVVVGLRPYSAKANILPEQTIGRGLRLMFRGSGANYVERVDVIGNKAFIAFVEDLERIEGTRFDTFNIGEDELRIVTILPVDEKMDKDIGVPVLTPLLVRRKSISQEIADLDVTAMDSPVLPRRRHDKAADTFRYEGRDIITLEKVVEREYTIPEPQTPQEVIGYYARRIATDLKLPSQFAAIAPKVREFLERKAFGAPVQLDDPVILKAISTNVAAYVVTTVFRKALLDRALEEPEPKLAEPDRMLSTTRPFPWSGPAPEATKTVFNLVACVNEYEREFALFLESCEDVTAFSKLPEVFGFAIEYTDASRNLHNYYPDFVAVGNDGLRWLLETKGQETVEVEHKDRAAVLWCETASRLTGRPWRYVKALQAEFQRLRPIRLRDLGVLAPADVLQE